MSNKLLLKDITDIVANKLNLNKEDSYEIGSEIFEAILDALSENKSVMVYEFGIFSNKLTKSRDLRCFNGTKNNIVDYMLPKFSFSKKIRTNLKDAVNNEKHNQT